MSLSILCVTKNEEHALEYIHRLSEHASLLGAELVLAFDGHMPEWGCVPFSGQKLYKPSVTLTPDIMFLPERSSGRIQ